MKRVYAFLALCGLLSACSSHYPIVGESNEGEKFQGEVIASLSGGTFHITGEKGTTCDGTYDQWSLAATLVLDAKCADGRTGKFLVTRDASLTSGTGEGKLSDGTKFTFTFGDHSEAKP